MLKKRFISLLCAAATLAAAIPGGFTVFAEDEKIDLTGKPQTGSAAYANTNLYSNAFDGDVDTFFDGLQNGYCQVDLDGQYAISKLRFYPRKGKSTNLPSEYVKRMNGGVFSGSADGRTWTVIYTVPDDFCTTNTDEAAVTWYDVDVSGTYRFIKYENASNAANIAEIEVYGIKTADAEPVETETPPTQEPLPDGFTLLDRTGWTAEANSQQSSSGQNSAGMVLDGDTSTMWHSSWGSDMGSYNPDTNPLYLTVNTGSKQVLTGIRYTPRKKGTAAGDINGVITSYEVYVSDDNTSWTKAGEGNLGYTADDAAQEPKNIIFAPVEGQYIRLVVIDNLSNSAMYAGSCAEFDAYTYTGDINDHPITAARASLDETISDLNSLSTEHEIKTKLLAKADTLKTDGTVDGIESFIEATASIIDALDWMSKGIDDVYLDRIMTLLSDADISASAVSTANNELAGFYRPGSEAKEKWADAWQDEFTMSEDDYDKPLYERLESAITRAKARIDSNDGNDYIMLKELVSYVSGKYEYTGYENPFGRNTDECEAVVSNINFALANLEKMGKGELDTELTTYNSGEIWLDTLGSKISAHGGQIIKQGDTYYWYGEDNKISYALTTGVSCYSSKDLKNWKYEGLAFKVFDDGTEDKLFTDEFMSDNLLGTQGRIERPKVIYNEKTGKYVMWMHLEKDGGYSLSVAGVAVSDSPTGPFKWLWYGTPVYDTYVVNRTKNRTDELTFRDMNLFVDDDGKAYVFYSSESNQVLYAVQLNADYTWINDEGLESSGATVDDIQEGKVITPDMRVITTANNTYGKTSFTRYQLASGGGMALEKSTDEDGSTIYVSQRKDDRLYIPEYPETGRWARVGQNAAEENKVEGKTQTTVNNSCNNQREAPAPIEIDGKYYMVTSALSGWKANPSLTQVADSILGTWTPTGNPMTGDGPVNNGQWSQDATWATSFNSQSTCVLELPNGEYMYMGDRWKNGVYEPDDAVDVKASTYVWLPITFETDTTYGENTLKVRWADSWSYDKLSEAAANLKIYGTDPYVYGNLYLPTESKGAEVTWKSSNESIITTTGEVTRPASDTSVTLTAALTVDGETAEKTFTVTVKAAPQERTNEAYLFVHFKDGTDTADNEQIYFSVSKDGMNWEKVNSGLPVIKSTLGTGGLRDPHIVRSPEGDKYFMIATDLSIYKNSNWTTASNSGSKSIMVWESTDLVNWTEQRMVEIAPEGAGCAWAPESIYNEETGAYMVYWASKTDGKQKIYCSETRDFVNFTEPQVYVEKDNDVIDSTIIEEDGVFYRFSKDETDKNVILEKSNSLYGTFTKLDNFSIPTCEGPTCFKLNGENKWCLLVDFYSGSGYAAYTSTDIASGEFTKDSSYSTPYTFRHGTVIPISMEEYDAITEAYQTPVLFDDDAEPGTINIPEAAQEEPVIWYDFEDIENGVIPDKSGNGNTGALHSGGEYNTTNEKIGATIKLDTAGNIVLPDNITKNLEDFTISMWINVQERGSGIHNKNLFTLGDKIYYVPQGNGTYGYHMYTKFGSSNVISDTTQLSMDPSNQDKWSQLTIVKQGETVSMYVDGKLDTTGNIGETTQSLGVLNNNTIGVNMALNIDEFKLYNRALSSAEALVKSAEGLSDADAARMIVNGIDLGDTTNLTESIELPVYGDVITWSTTDSNVIAADGTITRSETGKTTATLTATVKVGSSTSTRDFDVSVNGLDSYDYTINVSNEKGVDIQQGMYGLFFEDINFAADGGLYAELIENRSFEAVKYVSGTKTEFDGLYGWTANSGTLEISDTGGLNENNTHYAVFTADNAGQSFKNQAYDGIYLTDGVTYNVSFYAKAENAATAAITVEKDGTVYAEAEVTDIEGEWNKYETSFTADETVDGADFVITLADAGTVSFDMVSVIPDNAVEGVFRKDLAEKLKALEPGFLRFPGGCIIEGTNLDNRYNWKDSVGPVEERKQNWNRWAGHTTSGADNGGKHYNQTYGLGFYEYFVLCEYLGAKALPVVNCGMACQYQGNETVDINSAEFQQYIQDALDLIEFANGDTDTEWGALRAEMGHPEPFNLELLGIGNEQWETSTNNFHARYEAFEAAIHEQYPEMKLVGTAGPTVQTNEYNTAWSWIREKAAENPDFAYVIDEHYYMTPDWFYANDDFYDSYPRDVKVFAGEYASRINGENRANYPQANRLGSALSEAAFMTGFERNADVVYMASYAPLFARVNYTQWSPDMIWFDGRNSYVSPSYYTQQMYSTNLGDYTVKTDTEGNTEDSKLYQTVSYDEETGDLIIKVVNNKTKAQTVKIDLSSYSLEGTADVTVLAGDDTNAYNDINNPENVVPATDTIDTASDFRYEMPANSFSVIRVHTTGIDETFRMDITKTENSVSCSYSVPQSETRTLNAYLAIYDENHVLRGIKSTALTSEGAELTIELPDNGTYECSAFIWDDNQKPVTAKVTE